MRALAAAAALVLATAAQSAATVRIGLYGPDNFAFDSAGHVYLIDTDHAARSRILELTPDGRVLADWRVFTDAAGRQNGPDDIAVDRGGNVYVNDAGAGTLLRVSPEGQAAVVATGVGAPAHVAVAADGTIYLADAPAGTVRKLSPSGAVEATWRTWKRPQSVGVLSDGEVAVDDWGNDRIVIVGAGGATLRTFRAAGETGGPLVSNSGMFVDGHDHIWVADYQHPRVKEYDAAGRLLRMVENTPGHAIFEHTPSSIAVDAAGVVYCADGGRSVVKFTAAGRVLGRWR